MAVPRDAAERPETDEALSFEAALERLERAVERLEGGELPLEEALLAFEEGVALSRRCAAQVDDAERRIEQLVRQGGAWVARSADDTEDDAEADD